MSYIHTKRQEFAVNFYAQKTVIYYSPQQLAIIREHIYTEYMYLYRYKLIGSYINVSLLECSCSFPRCSRVSLPPQNDLLENNRNFFNVILLLVIVYNKCI